MKSDPHNVDDLLKKLADYQPSAEPDWESFYADYQNKVESQEKSFSKDIKNEAISTTVKSSIIVFMVFTVAISTYYLFFRNQAVSEVNETSPIESQTKTTKEASPTNTYELIETEKRPESNKQTKPEATNDHIIPQKQDFEAQKVKTPVPGSALKPANEATTYDSIQEHSISRLKSASPDDSHSQNQVIIKKTVVISDTLRIKRRAPK